MDAGVLSVTRVHAGEATNVVPDTCELHGMVRTFSLDVLDLVEKRIQEASRHTCQAFGAECDFTLLRTYPPTIHHEEQAATARRVMTGIVGAENMLPQQPAMTAEDFSIMLQAKSGCYSGGYCFIGNGLGGTVPWAMVPGLARCKTPVVTSMTMCCALGACYWGRLAEDRLKRA